MSEETCKYSKTGISFEQWCKENNEQDTLDRWDYALNNYKPSEISYGSRKKCWFKCNKEIHESELKHIGSFTTGQGAISCKQCNSFGQWLIDNYGSNAIKRYWSKKNIENPFNISIGSHKKIWTICQICGKEKSQAVKDFIKYGLHCLKCSDGISFPNKICFNILDQLINNFESEYSPNWIKPMRYDFYFEINNKKYIIEMDGGWHFKDNNMNGKTKEESKYIDDYKDKSAEEHNIKVIRIDCKSSEIEYIKNNILKSELSQIIELKNVDWIKSFEFSCNSMIKIICDFWNNGFSINKIIDKTKLGKNTIIRYLKKGNELKLCDYNTMVELKYGRIKNKNTKEVYCVEQNKSYTSMREIERMLDISHSNIARCCKDNQKTAGGYHWMYYEDYLKLHSNESK